MNSSIALIEMEILFFKKKERIVMKVGKCPEASG